MTKSTKINKLAIAAQQDTKELKAAGITLHEESYTESMWMLGFEFDAIIRSLSDQHGPKFNKTMDEEGSTAFERRLRKRLMECTLTYDGVRDFEALVRRTFERTTREFYKRRTSYAKNEDSFDELTTTSEGEGESKKVVQFADEKSFIEKQIEQSELVTALFNEFGTTDKRRKILVRFMDEKDISYSELARELSGQSEGTAFNTMRTFISRFLKDIRCNLLYISI
ncbi:hypothetical protein ACQKGI_15050 [Peribacillus muralis]|uniref:hypothetical protein n=1 Tax=Peribacillus muralis TaxID=264697 RepID=UPI0038278A53